MSSANRVNLNYEKTTCGQYTLTKNNSRKRKSTAIILWEKISLYLTVKYSMLMKQFCSVCQ